MKLCTACRRHVRPDAGACPFCGETLRTTSSTAVGALVLLGALGASCTSRPVEDSATGASTGSSSSTTQPGTSTTSATTTTLPDPTTSTSSPGTTTANSSTGELSTTNDVDTTDQGCAFYGGCPTDFTNPAACDVWAQDCPPGEKCMPYSGDGDNSWESLKCTPVAPNPGQHGDPCTTEGGGVSGIDSCDVGHMCWNLDMNGEGHCVAFCTGSPDMPMCAPPMTTCTISQESVLILCLPSCNPLMNDCDPDEACIPSTNGFLCVLDASGDEGQEFDACESFNACDPGLFCADPMNATECDPNVIGCCLSFCDLTMPACNGQGAECVPWLEISMAPPGPENLGACILPP